MRKLFLHDVRQIAKAKGMPYYLLALSLLLVTTNHGTKQPKKWPILSNRAQLHIFNIRYDHGDIHYNAEIKHFQSKL